MAGRSYYSNRRNPNTPSVNPIKPCCGGGETGTATLAVGVTLSLLLLFTLRLSSSGKPLCQVRRMINEERVLIDVFQNIKVTEIPTARILPKYIGSTYKIVNDMSQRCEIVSHDDNVIANGKKHWPRSQRVGHCNGGKSNDSYFRKPPVRS